ncbi:MAG TPA: UDP-N-acetylmuramoyl-tripeptide--D-alanyl-D-alanine ligase [Burkholderiales bacterium]|nr:UDP-N-acetylmuramoyl-tripeptide--D-alanyl-D-alanine ligase [Burkholderiales bacterium]
MLDLQQAAAAISAVVKGENVTFSAVSSDTRTLKSGELFVALKGEHYDGRDFLVQARQKGAVAALVAEAEPANISGLPLLVVKDTRASLGMLAAYWRSRFDIPVVGLTGSNGKTTVKEMLASILRMAAGSPHAVLATRGNLNNDIGVPLTLLEMRSHHRYAVIEMGTNHPGEISYLTRLTKPDVALVNNAARAHLSGLISVEQVARAKGEIFEGLSKNGVAVINADDQYAELWRRSCADRRVLDFGFDRPAAISARCALRGSGADLEVETGAGEIHIKLQVAGQHNARNALAAATCALALGIKREAISAGLSAFAGVKGRLQRKRGKSGALLIDDTYNANPESVRAAVDVLSAEAGKKVLVLGDMGELGTQGPALHEEIGTQAKDAGIDVLYTLGELAAGAALQFGKGGRHFTQIEELLAEVEKLLAPDVAVLVKGSRFMRMERIVERLAAE